MDKPNFPEIEKKWRKYWEDHGISKFEDDGKKPLYVLDTPPPFPTGEFHTGSTLNWGYIDFAARYKRMTGHAVLFPQGWDCHGFPTETKVEAKFGKLPRDEFRQKCLEWTHSMVSSIKEQMKQMGFSIDWAHEYYTIDKEYHRKVQLSLLEMHQKDMIYRGKHPVLFCTNCESAIAKAETDDVAREGQLNFIKFGFEKGKTLTIATSRPELLHACVGLAFNPQDDRYKTLEGKMAFSPIFNKPVRIVADASVDQSFGTGMVMICTFGDRQDVVWMYKFQLPLIGAFDELGRVINANETYNGLYASKARAKIIEDLKSQNLLEKQEKIQQTLKVHDRCKKPIELMSSNQWFIKLKGHKEEIISAANQMEWFPEHMLQLLKDWASGLEWDWVISRQRVFGIPLPFYYCNNCNEAYLPLEKDLPIDPAKHPYHLSKCKKCGGEIRGETSICDGWVDSSITPLIISKWKDDEKTFNRLYSNIVRPQGTDIIRTWAFYSIFRCLMLTGKPPFKQLLINGMVLGSDGKKMSKSAGNYIEAKEVIAKSSVDALRQWIALSGTTGKDNIFYWKDVNYSQTFLTKLWNVGNFVEKSLEGYLPKEFAKHKPHLRLTDQWILGRLNETIALTEKAMESYNYYEAIVAVQSFFWKEFADLYLEDVKYRIYQEDAFGKESKEAAQFVLREVLLKSLQMLSPFIVYTTEELFHNLFKEEAAKHKSIHKTDFPKSDKGMKLDEQTLKASNLFHALISDIRKYKASNQLSLNTELSRIRISLPENMEMQIGRFEEDIKAVCKAKQLEFNFTKEEIPKVECFV